MLANGDLSRETAKTIDQVIGENKRLSRFIPSIPEAFCFVDENFLSESFSVESFVRRNSRRVTSLEKLKEDLATYLKTLKQSMVDLINEDYTEFINLSANLVSFDKSIGNIKKPVIKFKDETSQVKTRIEEIIVQLNAKQYRLKIVRDNKLKLNLLLEIIKYLDRLEVNIDQLYSEKNALKLNGPDFYSAIDENATLISRLNMNFDYLLENAEKTSNPLVLKLKQRLGAIELKFNQVLENEVMHLLCYDLNQLQSEINLNEILKNLEQLFRIYMLNGKQSQLELMIKTKIVKPCFDEIINEVYIGKNGVKVMLEQITEMIDSKCVFLLKLLTSSSTFGSAGEGTVSQFGYQLLVASIWDQFVECCTVRTPSLFSLIDVEIFQSNYLLTFQFVEDFLCKTNLVEFRAQFEQLASYKMLKSKFNLNVYFHMKLQQIVSIIERRFSEWCFSLNTESGQTFKLRIFTLIYETVVKCWQTNSRAQLGDLFIYLWKLTLKIIARFYTWLSLITIDKIEEYLNRTGTVTNNDAEKRRMIHRILGALVHDSRKFTATYSTFYQTIVLLHWQPYCRKLISHHSLSQCKVMIQESSLDASFVETTKHFEALATNKLADLMKIEITNECKQILNFVNDIPRLYRRTNKDKPSKASNYIYQCSNQLLEYLFIIDLELKDSWLHDWFVKLLVDLTHIYKTSTLEVLTSVQKTEDSLKKLKKSKPNSSHFRNVGNSLSDDDKIRLQIYYDVEELGKEFKSKFTSVDVQSLMPYRELYEMVNSLKVLI